MFVRIDSNYKLDDKLLGMCNSAHLSNDPTAENIESLDWWDRPETLLHQIYKQKVYDKGGYFVYEEDGKYIGGLGFYPFEEDSNIFVSPVRMYVVPDLGLRKSIRTIQKLVNEVFTYAKDDYRAAVFFVNDHNHWRLKSAQNAVDPKKNPYVVFPNLPWKTFEQTTRYKHTDQTAVYLDYTGYEEEILKCLKKISL